MFLVKMFKDSFNFKTLLINFKYKWWQLILYFILLILIANIPLTLEAINNYGTRLDFIIEDFSSGEVPNNWEIPNDIQISGGKLINNGDQTEYTFEFKGITYIINKQGKIEDVDDFKSHIILGEESIVYIDANSNILENHGYIGFQGDTFDFYTLKTHSGEDLVEIYQMFAASIERSFQSEIILFTVVRNNLAQILVNIIYIIVLALLIQLFRFGYANFLNFRQSIKFVILSLGLPATLSFLIGFLSPAFAPVMFQLSSGLVVMFTTLIFGKKLYS